MAVSPTAGLGDKLLPPRKASSRFLYKFRSIRRLEWLPAILLRNELYFPTALELNDPDEARPKVVSAPLRAEAEKFRRYVPIDPTLSDAGYHARWNGLMKHISQVGDLQLLEMQEKALHRHLVQNRLFSLTKRPDNLHLWQEYADNHTGYCLEFRNQGPVFSKAFEVRYQDRIEIDVADEAKVNPWFYFYKTPKWKEEEEVRICMQRDENPIVTFQPRLLTRIILGNRISVEHEDVICGLVAQRQERLLIVRESDVKFNFMRRTKTGPISEDPESDSARAGEHGEGA